MRWEVEKTGDHLWVVEPRASGMGVERVVSHFCDDYLQLTPEAQARRDADARLIAAAPTMLAALQSIRDSITHALQNERRGAEGGAVNGDSIEPGYFLDSDGKVKPLPVCSTCSRDDVRVCWSHGHQPMEPMEVPSRLNGYERDVWRGMKTQSVRDLLVSISNLRAEREDLRSLAQRPLVNQVDLGDVVRLALKTAASMAEEQAKNEAEVMAARRLQLLGLDVMKAVLREMTPATRA